MRHSSRDGGFTVSYPSHLHESEVHEFIKAHEGWILAHHKPKREIAYGHVLPYRGQSLPIYESTQRGVKFEEDRILVKSVHIGRALSSALKVQAQEFALPKLDHYAEMLGSHVNEVRFRDPKTRWGSCDASGNIMLSWRLIMTPDWVFDYVIAHECAHLIHMNHSSKFWNLLKKINPDYARAKAYLHREGSMLQSISF